MSKDLRKQIYSRMNNKETDELLEIWQSNHRYEWSDEAFEIINEILRQRGVEILEQDEPVHEQVEKEIDQEEYDFSEEELKIIDDENPPAFYVPFEVLLLTKRLDWVMKIMIVFIVVYNIFNYPSIRGITMGFFPANPNIMIVYVISAILALANAVLNIIFMYIPLKVLVRILRIFMEMEFRSRKGIKSNSVVE